VVANEVERWPEDEPFALHPRMQRVTLEVILRAVFGVTDPGRRERLAEHLGRLLTDNASAGLQFGVLLSRRLGAADPLRGLEAQRRAIDAMLDVEISERRSDPRDDILSMLIAARFEEGEAPRGAIAAMLAVRTCERRSAPRDDILSMLIAARFEDGARMTDAEI